MKILIDVHGLRTNRAGKVYYTLNLLQGLSELPEAKKHSLFLFSPGQFSLGFPLPANFFWKIEPKKGLKFYLNLFNELKSGRYDLLWSPTSFIPLAFGPGKKIGIVYDLVAFEKNAFVKDKKATIIERLLIRKAIEKSTALVTISQNTGSGLIEKFPQAKEKTFVILGSPKKYSNLTSKQKVLQKYSLENQKYLLFVGTLEPRKNLPNILTAYGRFLDRLKSESQFLPPFVLAGQKGWNCKNIFQTIQKLKLSRQVKWLGYVPEKDLPALYQSSKFLVYAPFCEGFGLPIIEAISFGKTCITSNTSSLPEAVGPCGIKVDPNNIQDISEAAYRLWSNDELRRNYEQKTKEWISQFSNKKNAQILLEVLKFAEQAKSES